MAQLGLNRTTGFRVSEIRLEVCHNGFDPTPPPKKRGVKENKKMYNKFSVIYCCVANEKTSQRFACF